MIVMCRDLSQNGLFSLPSGTFSATLKIQTLSVPALLCFVFFFFGDWGWAVQPGTRYVTYDTEHSLLACRLLASNKILRLDSDIFEPLTDLVTL